MSEWGSPAALAGKVAVITGAGRGIGRDIACAYADAGATVVCAARTALEIDETVERIRAAGGNARAQVTDVTDAPSVEKLFADAAERFGRIDVAVLNAGVTGERVPIGDSEPATWRIPLEVNLIGSYLCARAAIPHLTASGGGKIITIGSGARLKPAPGLSAYAVSKIGLWMFVRALAEELRPHHIAVNEIIPGPVYTGLLKEGHRWHPNEWFKQPADVARFAVFVASLPDDGPTGQSFSMLARDSSG